MLCIGAFIDHKLAPTTGGLRPTSVEERPIDTILTRDMVNNAAADPATQAYRNTMEGMFSNKGVDELAPRPRFDYETYELKWDEVDSLVERITDALVKIEDKTGRFRYQRASALLAWWP